MVNKGGKFWIFVFLFAKNDMANINVSQLKKLKKLAGDYQMAKPADLDVSVANKDLMEIFNG